MQREWLHKLCRKGPFVFCDDCKLIKSCSSIFLDRKRKKDVTWSNTEWTIYLKLKELIQPGFLMIDKDIDFPSFFFNRINCINHRISN